MSSCYLFTANLITLLPDSLQNSTHSIDQTEKAAAGEAGVRAGGGQDQKGSVYVCG